MKSDEFLHILTALFVFTIILSFSFALKEQWNMILTAFLSALIILAVSISSKKIMANLLDAEVEHSLWTMSRFGFKPEKRFKNAVPTGILLPLLFSLVTFGFVKFSAFLTYETNALKVRAAKRFGNYSFTEMTEWHNGLIGAAGIFSVLLFSLICYLVSAEFTAKAAAFYALSNMIPLSKLDGTQIFFGSRILYITMLIITLIFFAYALVVLI